MTKRKSIFIIGLLIFLLPAFGFPSFWESTFQVLSGLALMIAAMHSSIGRRLHLANKRHKGPTSSPVFVDSNPSRTSSDEHVSLNTTAPSMPLEDSVFAEDDNDEQARD